MTDQIEALRTLIEKVEEKRHPQEVHEAARDALDLTSVSLARQAYCGSLDAAKALHEAMLHGWSWEFRESGFGSGQAAIWNPLNAPHHGGTTRVDNDVPARAWLIAILKALIEKVEG